MKEEQFSFEQQFLSPHATFSAKSLGRVLPTEDCPYRTDFQRDRDRILHSKAFRRLKHKTQVFLSPEGDHYRTRLTHTLEVSQIARTIARALRLNEDLVEAIAYGHDLGHTPFGHAAENMLDQLNPQGFSHNIHSLRVCNYLENDGHGLNLTAEVLDGILNHKKEGNPATLEGKVVSYADRIAYVNHDIEDAICAKILSENDIPITLRYTLGNTKSQRITTLIDGLIKHSTGNNFIALPTPLESSMEELRQFMFESVYKNPLAKAEEAKAVVMIEQLYGYYKANPRNLPSFYLNNIDTMGIDTCVTDFIAGMTDRYAVSCFTNIYIPKNWGG